MTVSLAAVVDAIDEMLTAAQSDASALARLDAWIRAADPGAMDDDAAIAVLVASVPAAAPLRAAREDYAARLRGVLSTRGHSAAGIAAALDGLMQDDGAVCGAEGTGR